MPVTVVPTSLATVAIDTFMTELSSVIRNCADASVSSTIPAAPAAPSAASLTCSSCPSPMSASLMRLTSPESNRPEPARTSPRTDDPRKHTARDRGSRGGVRYVADVNGNRELVERFITSLEARYWDTWAALLDPAVVYEIPQSRERIRGRDRYLRVNQ